jgi:hypothetical protein
MVDPSEPREGRRLVAAQAKLHPGIREYLAAADRFDRLFATSPELPRLTDPVAGPLLRRLTDSSATLGNDSYRWSHKDVSLLVELETRTETIRGLYEQSGITPGQLESDPGVAASEALNNYEFQDEIIPFFTFFLDVFSRYLQIVPSKHVRDNTRPSDEVFGAMIGLAGDPKVRLPNRIAVIEGLVRNVRAFSKILDLTDRRQLVAGLAPLRSEFPAPVQARIDRMIEILGSNA